MNIQELINFLQIAKEKVGPDVEVLISNSYDDEENEISDITMKGQYSIINSSDDEVKVLLTY